MIGLKNFPIAPRTHKRVWLGLLRRLGKERKNAFTMVHISHELTNLIWIGIDLATVHGLSTWAPPMGFGSSFSKTVPRSGVDSVAIYLE